MKENKVIIDGVEIHYLRKPGKYDTNHLVVVFSGFSGDGKPIYNYNNALLSCPSDVLWIKDSFEGGESYYLCCKGLLNVESSIYKFISGVLNELNLTHNDCTLLGGSKGGSAALYYGMKYNFSNIIATVPQFFIGTYVEIDWNYAFKHMMGNKNPTEIIALQESLDSLIINAIQNSNPEKNIYLITSFADPQYETEIKDNIELFQRFDNFNILYANSSLISKHNQVNRHIVSITMSITALTAKGIAPKFNTNEIKYRKKDVNEPEFLKPYVELRDFSISNNRFFIEGVSVITGIPCPTYDDIHIRLLLKGQKDVFTIELAKGNKAGLKIPNKSSVSYDKGWFCTEKYQGLLIDELPIGTWDAYIQINARGIVREIPLRTNGQVFDLKGDGVINSLDFHSDDAFSRFCVIAR